MICQRYLISPERSNLWSEQQRLMRELLRVNHQLAIEAAKLGLTIKEAVALAKGDA